MSLRSVLLSSTNLHEGNVNAPASIVPATILSAVLWAATLIAMCVWLSIPLSFGDALNLELFLIWRTLYLFGTIAFFWGLVQIGMPRADQKEVFAVIVCSLAVGLVGDWSIAKLPEFWRENYIRATPLFIAPPVVLGLYIVILRAHKRQSLVFNEKPLQNLGSGGVHLCPEGKFYYATLSDVRWAFFKRVKLGLMIVGCYLSCTYYPILMHHVADTESENALFVLAFPFATLPWSFAMDLFARQIDNDFLQVEAHPKFQELSVWVSYCFSFFYVRDLFINVVEVSTVVTVNLTSAAKLVLLFPIRMSRRVFEWQKYIYRVCGVEDNTSLEDFRLERCRTFYFLCMAERITITTFPLCLVLVHHNYNAPFLEAQRGPMYNRFVEFCFITLGIEWTVSTFVTIVIMKAFSLNPVLLGGRLLSNPQFRLCALWASIHICSDYYAATVHTGRLGW